MAAAAPASPAAAPAGAPAATWKVFVGNLSFKTREDQLRDEFAAHTKVLQANIITRGPRSLGYGFVEFATEDDAEKAVAAMNKKSIDGREINVEVAKPRAEGEAPAAPRQNGGERPARGNFRGGFRGGRRRGGAAAPANAAAPAAAGAGAEFARGRGGRGGGRGRSGPRTRGGAAAAGGAAGGEGAERAERGPRAPSDTTLFVANLPFSVDDAGLREIFQDFAPASAHVVIKRNGRSKGFGFVEFKSKDDQAKALAAQDGKEVQGRPLIVRVAQVEVKADAAPAAEEEKKN